MILLKSTDELQLVTGSARTVDVYASYVDVLTTTSAITPDRKLTLITTQTTTPIVSSPAANTIRNVKGITIRNRDTQSCLCTVQLTDGSNVPVLAKVTLQSDDVLAYSDLEGWSVLDGRSNERRRSLTPGQFIKTTNLRGFDATVGTNGNANMLALSPYTRTVRVRLAGAGAAGGGCSSVAASAAAAGGGGGGSYLEKTLAISAGSSLSMVWNTIAPGGVSGGTGASPANAVFYMTTAGATVATLTAFSGVGGPLAGATSILSATQGGAGGTLATGGDLNCPGHHGHPGVVINVAGVTVMSGRGASAMGIMGGTGGRGLIAAGAGTAGGATGGGGGSATGAAAARAGGNGTFGLCIIDEYT